MNSATETYKFWIVTNHQGVEKMLLSGKLTSHMKSNWSIFFMLFIYISSKENACNLTSFNYCGGFFKYICMIIPIYYISVDSHHHSNALSRSFDFSPEVSSWAWCFRTPLNCDIFCMNKIWTTVLVSYSWYHHRQDVQSYLQYWFHSVLSVLHIFDALQAPIIGDVRWFCVA